MRKFIYDDGCIIDATTYEIMYSNIDPETGIIIENLMNHNERIQKDNEQLRQEIVETFRDFQKLGQPLKK